MVTNWLSALDSPLIGVVLGLAAGFLLGRIWRNLKFRDQLLLLKLQLEAKSDEAVALRTRLRQMRAGARRQRRTATTAADVGLEPAEMEGRVFAKKEFSNE